VMSKNAAEQYCLRSILTIGVSKSVSTNTSHNTKMMRNKLFFISCLFYDWN
jgi:hypothetical protein